MTPELSGSLADVEACEERLLACWPSHSQQTCEGWLCRFAAGYSGRANSASPLRLHAPLPAALRREIEQLYQQRGLRPSFRLSPVTHDDTRRALEDLGYAPEDPSIGMIGPAFSSLPSPALRLEPQASPDWLEGTCRWQIPSKRDSAALAGIVQRITIPTRFATLFEAGEPVAYGLITLAQGWAEFGAVMVDPAKRGRGLGEALVRGMIGWAEAEGATRIFFQVAFGNAPALKLYRKLGFEALYTTAYWRQPWGQS